MRKLKPLMKAPGRKLYRPDRKFVSAMILANEQDDDDQDETCLGGGADEQKLPVAPAAGGK